jgi:hypothetical protein
MRLLRMLGCYVDLINSNMCNFVDLHTRVILDCIFMFFFWVSLKMICIVKLPFDL